MPVTILNSPPNSVAIEITDTRPLVEIGFGYTGAPFSTELPIVRVVKTANHTLELSDKYKLIDMNVAGDNTLTIPPNSAVNFDIGTAILLSQYGAGQTSILAGSGVTLRSESSWLKLFARYCGVVLIKIDTDEWYVQGALKA
jgi:hypothetical protein